MTPRNALPALPTAALHLHIEGTPEPELAFRPAVTNGIELPAASVDELLLDIDGREATTMRAEQVTR